MSEDQLIPTPGVFGENGNFLLERELGRGGMGGVYLGRDKMLDRPVAVKVMLREYGNDAEFVEKFKKEAQAAARLIHPNIAQIYSYGITDGMPYIAMELVAGGSLFGLMKNAGAKSDVPRMLKICEQVAQALRCASDQGLVHGDIKPENILLDANGNAKIVDFGLSAMAKETDEIWGTPYYIAPEKVRKQTIDYRADMYSLGGTLYHALTGVAPFEGTDATEVVKKRFEGKPRKPSEVRPDGITPQVDFLVMKMLELDPANRYPTFEALIDDFQKVMKFGLGRSQLAVESAAPAAKPALKRKKLSVNPARRNASEPAAQDEAAAPAPEAKPAAGRLKVRGAAPKRVSGVAARHRAPETEEPEDNAGKSMSIVVLSVVGAIVLVVGGLIWYQVHDRNVREAERRAQIERGFSNARDALAKTRDLAQRKSLDLLELAGKAEAACEKHTKKLGEEMRRFSYSEEVIALLRPAPTQDLLDAIASTNTVADAEAGDKGKGEKTKKAAEARDPMAPPEPALRPAVSSRAAAEFRPPTEDEADPMSPAHAEYLKEKKKWEEARKNAPPEPEPAPEVVLAVPDGGPQVKVPAVVSDVHELWERAYTCRACEIRLNAKIAQLNAKIDAAMKLAGGDSEAELRAVADQSRACKEDFDSLLASKDYETLRKGSSWIESRGQKVVKRETDRMITEKGIATREQEKKDREAQDRLRKERQEKEHAELVEKEIAAAKASFAKVIDNRNLKLLDWAGGLRMIRDVGQDFNTSEGDLELTKQLKKVEAMKLFHDIMIRNLKGYTFARGGKNSLKGMTVVEVDEQTLSYKKKEAVRAKTIQWVKFYRDYHTNLNELLNRFVRNGRANGEPKLNLKEWAEAMIGASLTLQIVCDDDPSAVAYGEQLIKEMVKQFPNFLGRAKESFPTIDFSDVASEVESGEF